MKYGSSDWETLIAPVKNAFKEHCIKEVVQKDSYGDKSYIYIVKEDTNIMKIFWILGKTESQKVLNESGLIYIHCFRMVPTGDDPLIFEKTDRIDSNNKINKDNKANNKNNDTPENINVVLNGDLLNFDVPPMIINDRTMVPLRVIFEALNASVEWDDYSQTVTAKRGNTQIKLTINNHIMYVNDSETILDSPACLVNGRTLVPVRAISEAFKADVNWDNDTNTVFIKCNTNIEEVVEESNEYVFEPFEELKNYLLQNGTKSSQGAYCILEDFENVTLFMSYSKISSEIIGITLDLPGTKVGSNSTMLILKKDDAHGAVVNIETESGSKSEFMGTYYSSQLTFIESPYPSLNDSVEKLLKTMYKTVDIYFANNGVGVKISDFGIDY